MDLTGAPDSQEAEAMMAIMEIRGVLPVANLEITHLSLLMRIKDTTLAVRMANQLGCWASNLFLANLPLARLASLAARDSQQTFILRHPALKF